MDCENENCEFFALQLVELPFARLQNDKCFVKQAQKPFASPKFVIMTSYLVILSESEVSIKLKCILNSVDIFATATPCNPLGR